MRGVPVINMLTADHHPCQALADLMTLRERFGDLRGLRLVYVGDGNNVAHSLMLLGAKAGMEVVVGDASGAPAGREVRVERLRHDHETTRPAAAEGADALYTDVWVSMSDDEAQAAAAPASCSPRTGSTRPLMAPRIGPRPWRSTASRPTPARRSPRACSTASAPRSGTRRRTACTPRRRCWSC